MSPIVRNTDLKMAIIDFKALMLKFVAIYLLLTNIYRTFCRRHNNNNFAAAFWFFCGARFCLAQLGSRGSVLLGEVNHDFWRMLL